MFERCLYFNTNHLSRVVDKIWKDAFAPLGLSPAHAYLLRLVLSQPGLQQKDIGNELQLEKSTITRFIDKMVESGYLVRQSTSVDDVKYKRIFATNKATAIESELQNIGDRLFQSMTKCIGENEMKKFVKSARDISNNL